MLARRVRRRSLTFPLIAASILAGCEADKLAVPRIASIVKVSGDGQTAAAGVTVAQPFVVRLEDQDGAPIQRLEVSFTVSGGAGATVTPAIDSTDVNGLASATLRLGSVAGTYTVQARHRTLDPVVFTATATAAPPAALVISSGNNQTAARNTTLPLSLRVRVTDAFGNPNPGVTVTFAVTAGGGALSAVTVQADASGFASVNWTLGPSAGAQSVIAFTAGLAPVTFNATAL